MLKWMVCTRTTTMRNASWVNSNMVVTTMQDTTLSILLNLLFLQYNHTWCNSPKVSVKNLSAFLNLLCQKKCHLSMLFTLLLLSIWWLIWLYRRFTTLCITLYLWHYHFQHFLVHRFDQIYFFDLILIYFKNIKWITI